MNITVNQKTISAVLNDSKTNNELVATFNEIIDVELQKDNPDFDIIDECAEAINEIYASENTLLALKLMLTKKQVMKYCKHKAHNNNTMKAVVAACMVMIIGGVTVFNASPALAENVKSFFATIVSTLQIASDETDNGNENISSIYATLPEDTPLSVSSIDDVDLTKLTVTAVYDDASENNVEIKNCSITKTIEHTDQGSFVVVAISYDGCACSIAFELEG